MKKISRVSVNRVMGAFLGLLSSRFKILAYHSIAQKSRDPFEVSAEMFQQQMQLLVDEGYSVMPLEQAWNDLRTGHISDKTLVITFDDGFRSLLTSAFPVLEKYQFPATVFVPFDYIGKIDTFSYENPRADFEILSLDEIKKSMDRGISYGSHSMSHSDLTRLSPEKLRQELRVSKQFLNEVLGVEFSTLAYPFGMFDDRVQQAVIDTNYDCALCFGNILSNSRYTRSYEMKREKILSSTSLEDFRNLINVKNDFYRKTRHRLRFSKV